MTHLLIHGGMNKTGTTFIQNYFAANQEFLLRKGILYAETGRYPNSTAHHAVFASAVDNMGVFVTPLPNPPLKLSTYADMLNSEIAKTSPSHIVLSSEHLWHPRQFDRGALSRIQGIFAKYDTHIIIAIRDVESHMLSSYAQAVVGPQMFSGSIRDYIKKHREVWEYKKRLDLISSVFGKEKTHVFWYGEARSDLLEPFRRILGNRLSSTTANKAKDNVRRGAMLVAAMRRVNTVGGQSRAARRSLRGGLSLLESTAARVLGEAVLERTFAPLAEHEMSELRARSEKIKLEVDLSYDTRWWCPSDPLTGS